MTTPGGGVDIKALASRFQRDDVIELLRGAGLRVRGGLARCPFENCKDKGADHLDLRVHNGANGAICYCHSCKKSGDYIEVYRAVHQLDFKTALDRLADYQPAPVKPGLRLVRAAVLQSSSDKLSADAVRKAWGALAPTDVHGEAYLEQRRLREAVALGHVRFAAETVDSAEIKAKARAGYRAGMLLSSLAGQPLGIQFRLVIPGEKDNKRSLVGGHTKGVYFGRPADVVGSASVVVAEGMADTLTALLWVGSEPATAVIGVPGAGQVTKLVDALEEAGVDIAGKLFILLTQHDVGPRGNTSLNAFMQLKSRLQEKGADVVMETEPPGDAKDWAESWQLQRLPVWPPAQVARLLGGNSEAGETHMARATGAAIWHSEEPVEPEHLGQDLTTLAYLLSADVTRVPICGAGAWRLNEMTDEVEYGSAALAHDDYAQIRLNVESFRGGVSNKRLRFADADVRQVVRAIARRNRYSPVREYLERLGPHDGTDWWQRCGLEAMGLSEETHGLELTYLRLWAISAVARMFDPGCQVDTVLVLQGDEGQHKSRFFQELVPERRFFVRFMGDLSNEWKAIEAMRRGWIVELDEMASLLRARDYAEVLAFVARDVDTYAPKHVREAVAVPRRFVLGGSVNPEQFLADETGDRRFWVVRVRSAISREWLRENRDRLWAQALAEYRAGTRWYLPRELEALRRTANREHKVQHPWAGLVADYFEDKPFVDFVTMQELYGKCVMVEPAAQNGGTNKVLADVLRGLGWYPGLQSTSSHSRVRGWKRRLGHE